MPLPPMPPEAQAAYERALEKIEACGREGKQGTRLDLSSFGLTQVPPEIGQLSALTHLDLHNNHLTSLPPEIVQLSALTQLDLDNNHLTSLTPQIAKLSTLTRLDLANNLLTSLPSEISQISPLTVLNLNNNKLTSLPPEVGQLSSLITLVLRGNQVTALPPEIGQLSSLITLDLRSNRLATLPPQIGRLSSLTSLDLSNNQLITLPSELGQLKALSSLDLYGNKLSTLPPEIGLLTSAVELYLSNNQLAMLPAEIGRIFTLTTLDLRDNKLSVLPPEIGTLKRLIRLRLEDNALITLPEALLELTRLNELYLHGNKGLGIQAEVLGPRFVDSGPAGEKAAKPRAILTYYFAQRRGDKHPLNEVKVLVVGESGVGKTSLIRQLRGADHDTRQDKTHGIERHRVVMACGRLGKVRLNVWDFGGQEIMHATHQFFLTHRSVYLLVLDSRQNERQTRIEYWLRLIASYGGDSPVIVVCNKADQQVMKLNWTALKRDHPQIVTFAREVSCYHHGEVDRRRGLEELRLLIASVVEKHVVDVDKPMLTTWLDLKDELEADGRDYLTLDDYHQLASLRGITEAQDRAILLSLMHQLGSVLHFSEHAIFAREKAANATPAQIEELNVLNPGWVTTAIYKLLNDPALMRAGGQMSRGDLRRSLAELPCGAQRYPDSKHDFIIAMMRRFELCFAFDREDDRWFLPDLLHDDEVDTGDWKGAMAFRYQYRVLPGCVMGRLMVRMHHHIARHCLWRTGVKFRQGDCEALVRSTREEAQIDILIRGGRRAQRQEFLALIRGTLADIHRSFSGNLAVENQVALPGHPNVYVDYERLLLLEGNGTNHDHVKLKGKMESIKVTDVLNHLTIPTVREQERQQIDLELNALRDCDSVTVVHVYRGDYIQKDKSMHTDNRIQARDIINSQVGLMLTNCQNIIQQQAPGELKSLLEKLEQDVALLLPKLPEEKRAKVEKNLTVLVAEATSAEPDREWYSVSSKGLLEASKYVKDFTGNIAGTLGSLTKVLGL